jgi:hypothetical protein
LWRRAAGATKAFVTWKPTSFAEFWPYYVSQHLHPVNRLLHVAGTTAAIGCIAAAPLFPPLVLAAPVVGYGLAWIGHLAIEKNRPATWGNPLWSLRGDFKMWGLTLRGKMGAELEAYGQFAPPADARAEAA